jgi:hypothetical protein
MIATRPSAFSRAKVAPMRLGCGDDADEGSGDCILVIDP